MQLSRSGHAQIALHQINIYERNIHIMLDCMYKKNNVKRFEKAVNGATRAADAAKWNIEKAGLQELFGDWWAVL
ncbi:hypothetical protein [Shewanella sp. TB7-MNA-CIBAN-0143]|uniref:hypothetical protein n=1 Tax=Shewanella sp. TB7-MNA-CIBAN-0143 TaxID=3140465 RepID=UPI00331AC1B8